MSEKWVLVPVEPSDTLLRSMAIRDDHGLGLPGFYDQPGLGIEGVTHARRLECAMTTMRQLYEEVVGTGFAARPPVSRDWLDAAVERGARALAEQQIRRARRHDWTPHQFDEFLSTSIAICWPEYVEEARAAILAALEMTDEQ